MDYARVAHLYDLYASSTFDVPFFLRAARESRGPVLELMCGTGRVSVPLIEAGVDLCCVDQSRAMLEVLRRKLAERGLGAEIHESDVTRLALGRTYDLAFIPFHSFSEITGEAAQLEALRAVRAHLRPGGRFICTLHNPVHRITTEDGRPRLRADCPMADGGRLLLWGAGTFDPASRTVSGQQVYEIYAPGGLMQSRMVLDVRFSLLWRADCERLAQQAGLVVDALHGDYDRGAFDERESAYMIFELVRPA